MPRWLDRRTLAVVLAIVVGLGAATPALATITDIRSARVPGSAAPPSFGHPHVKLFSHYVKKMRIAVVSKTSGKGTASCPSPPATRKGWVQGMIESFDSPAIFSAFQLCAYLLKSPADAHAAFGQDVRSARKSMAAQNIHRLPASGIGDEVYALGGVQQGFGVDAIVYRHENALVELVYIGSSTYSSSSFIAVARSIDKHLK